MSCGYAVGMRKNVEIAFATQRDDPVGELGKTVFTEVLVRVSRVIAAAAQLCRKFFVCPAKLGQGLAIHARQRRAKSLWILSRAGDDLPEMRRNLICDDLHIAHEILATS